MNRPAATASLPNLSALSVEQLGVLFAAYEAAEGGFLSVFNQPRSRSVSDIVEDLAEDCTSACQRIVEHAGMRSPLSSAERRAKGEILMRWAIKCGEGGDEIALIVREHFQSEEAPS